jgi:intein/homing endonuclease
VALVNKFLNKKESLSDDILNGKINYQNCFLRGLYSGDGCIAISITPRKEKWRVEYFISLAVFNDKLMPSLIGLLKSLGYNPVFDKNQIRMHKKEDIKKFYKEIGFIKGGKIRQSQYWRGYEKNQVLKYVANYMGSDNELKGLKKGTKEEIIKHIKTQLTRM